MHLLFIFMHLADSFIQSDLQWIQAKHFCQYVCSLRIEPTTLFPATAMLYHWATGTFIYSPSCHSKHVWTSFFSLNIQKKHFENTKNTNMTGLPFQHTNTDQTKQTVQLKKKSRASLVCSLSTSSTQTICMATIKNANRTIQTSPLRRMREAPLLLFLYLTWRALSRCAETAGLSGEHNKPTESKMGTLVWPGTPNTGPWSVRRAGEMESQRPFVHKWLRLSGKAGQRVRVAKHHCAIERLWQDRAKNGERHEV